MNKKFKKMQITCRGIVCGNTRETRHHCAFKKSNGITLIALVITIIILLILAGVTLNIVFNGGLMDKAQNSVDQYADKAQNETELLDYIDKKFGQYVTALDNTNGTEHKKVGSVDYSYNNPVVPVGFKTVNTEKASWDSTDGKIIDDWNKGLVIEDSKENQFVWVPAQVVAGGETAISNVAVYGYQEYNIGSTGDISLEQSLPSGIASEDTQITTYGGFYIARYEAGIPTDDANLTEALTNADALYRNKPGTPVSKKNQIPWNRISWSQAKANAESMYTGTSVKSALITDRMWETTCKWLETSGVVVTTNGNGSIDWGNYNNAPVSGITEYSEDYGATWTPKTDSNAKGTVSWLLKTGHTEYTNRNNIYDLAGNLWEWTNAKLSTSSSYYVLRGGSYSNVGTSVPAAYRNYHSDGAGSNLGFRVALYVM